MATQPISCEHRYGKQFALIKGTLLQAVSKYSTYTHTVNNAVVFLSKFIYHVYVSRVTLLTILVVLRLTMKAVTLNESTVSSSGGARTADRDVRQLNPSHHIVYNSW